MLDKLLTRKPFEAAMEEKEGGLKRTLGAFDLTVLGIGAIIGAGIFVIAGRGAQVAGPGIMLSFVLVGIACLCAALCYAELASMIPAAGSAYAYTYATIGEFQVDPPRQRRQRIADRRLGAPDIFLGRRRGWQQCRVQISRAALLHPLPDRLEDLIVVHAVGL